MMKTLALIVPVQLSDEGTLQIKNVRNLKWLVGFLKDSYAITLIVRSHRGKTAPALEGLGVAVCYDDSPQEVKMPAKRSRFQTSYFRWAARNGLHTNETTRFDRLIAWGGCSPWCLATALRCAAERRLLWLQDDPNLYLMAADHTFYADLCGQFDSVMAADEQIARSMADICGDSPARKNQVLLRLPADATWYWEQSEQPPECVFRTDEINLLAVSRMRVESDLEGLPRQIAQLRERSPSLHCYLIGDGERLDRYIQQVAIYDVDSAFSFLGAQENPYPYLRACDALVLSEREKAPDMEIAAELFEVPTVPLKTIRQAEWKKKKASCVKAAAVWPDSGTLIDILEGVDKQ